MSTSCQEKRKLAKRITRQFRHNDLTTKEVSAKIVEYLSTKVPDNDESARLALLNELKDNFKKGLDGRMMVIGTLSLEITEPTELDYDFWY